MQMPTKLSPNALADAPCLLSVELIKAIRPALQTPLMTPVNRIKSRMLLECRMVLVVLMRNEMIFTKLNLLSCGEVSVESCGQSFDVRCPQHCVMVPARLINFDALLSQTIPTFPPVGG